VVDIPIPMLVIIEMNLMSAQVGIGTLEARGGFESSERGASIGSRLWGYVLR